MLVVEDLHASYGKIRAVSGVSLTVRAGEVVGVIGPNGAGKTTTLKCVAGLHKPSSGRVEFQGSSLLGFPPERIVALGVSMVPEGRRILASLTVEENLKLGATVRRDPGVAEDMERIFRRFPVLRRFAHTPAGRLSGGEQQQLALSRALVARPKLLLLDEPSLGLAPRMVDLVFETIDDLRREDVTILLVEQNAHRTLQLADRTYVMGSGEVKMQTMRGDLSEAQRKALAVAFVGSPRAILGHMSAQPRRQHD